MRGNIFKQQEPEIVKQYYDCGEGFWRRAKRLIGNVFRRMKGDEPLDYYEREEFDELWWDEHHW